MKQWEFPNKCRCGTWLYSRQAKKGYCSKCGPDKDTEAPKENGAIGG